MCHNTLVIKYLRKLILNPQIDGLLLARILLGLLGAFCWPMAGRREHIGYNMNRIAKPNLTARMASAPKLLSILAMIAGLAGSATAQVVLTPLNPTLVDDTFMSLNGNTPAEIDFINDSTVPVDVYWIDYSGDRVLYYPDLLPGQSYDQGTYLTHPWLIVENGTGGTTVQGTGDLITAFLPVTPNPNADPALADLAYINSVPEQPSWLVPLMALASIAWLRRKFAVLA